MIRRTLTVGIDDVAGARGALVCRDLPINTAAGPASIRRGAVVDDALWATLSKQTGARLDVVVPEPGEVVQGEASWRFAEAIVGPGLRVEPPHQGQCVIHAATRGVARVDARRVARVNRRETILLATALDGRVVGEGDTVAIVKAVRLWTHPTDLERSRLAAGRQPILRVAPFSATQAVFLAGPRIRPRNVIAASENLRGLLAEYGIDLVLTTSLPEDPDEIADVYQHLVADEVDLVLIGGSIVLDPAEPFITALDRISARLICRGAPIDPGTMFWVAQARGTLFLGLASCELYGRRSVLDLLLPYAAAGESITGGLLSDLGYGGLLEQTFDARRR